MVGRETSGDLPTRATKLDDVPYDVQGVLFDLDDTLLDHSTAGAAAILQLVRSVPDWREDDAGTVRIWRDLETEHFARYAAGDISMIDQRRARIRSFLALADAPEEVLDERFDAYLRSYREGWRAIPGGPEVVLGLLDEGYRVGVLTNGQGVQQRAKLAAIGLTDARLVVCVSEELPAAKPAAAYEAACSALGLAPEQVLMVGDHRTNDVDGARAAGLRAVHISPGAADRRTSPLDGVETIASVTDLRL